MANSVFTAFFAISVSFAALCFWNTPDRYPAAVHRAWLFNMLHPAIQDAYMGSTLQNTTWLAYATYTWLHATGIQLCLQISVFAGHGFQFLKFFVATIHSWSRFRKPCVDTAVMRASGIINGAKTVLVEITDTSVQLHSRLELMFNSTLARCVDGLIVCAVLLLMYQLLMIPAVVITALHPVVNKFCNAGRRVHWRGVFLLSIASVFGYVGYLWTRVV